MMKIKPFYNKLNRLKLLLSICLLLCLTIETKAQTFDYGDAPVSYDTNKDGVFLPAAHLPMANVYLGRIAPSLDVAPKNVLANTDNNAPNGDGVEEDALDVTSFRVLPNTNISITVNVTNSTGTNKFIYAWIDFNNNGRFEASEMSSYTGVTAGATTASLFWTAAQVGFNNLNYSKLYMRIRMADRALIDYTTGTDGEYLDEKSIGNGAASVSSSVNHATNVSGEVEDYWVTVEPAYDFGDAPISYDTNRDGVIVPARNIYTTTHSLGATIDAEYNVQSVAAGADNNGTNGDGLDEDSETKFRPIRKGVQYSVTVPVRFAGSNNTYAMAWIDFNNNGKFEANEAGYSRNYVSTTYHLFVESNITSLTFWFLPDQTSRIPDGTEKLYMRIRMMKTLGTDHADPTLDERSIGDGLSTGIYGTPSIGEVEDYQLVSFTSSDSFDFGDAPASYDLNAAGVSVPARAMPSPSLRLGDNFTYETSPHSVLPGANNNNANGDGITDDGIYDPQSLFIIANKKQSFKIKFKHDLASITNTYLYMWLDVNGDGKFQANEMNTNYGANGYQITSSTTSVDYEVPLSLIQQIPNSMENIYVRLRLSSVQLSDNSATADVDERAIGDGLASGVYGTTPTIGEIEDYMIKVYPGVACTTASQVILPVNGNINVNGIGITTQSTGDVINQTSGGNQTTSICTEPAPFGTLVVGGSLPTPADYNQITYNYKMTFSKPVNNIQLTIYSTEAGEKFYFGTEHGNASLGFANGNCNLTALGNMLINDSQPITGTVVTISDPAGAFQELTISGISYQWGSVVSLCGNSVLPANVGCTKPSTAIGVSLETQTGITTLSKRENWPQDIPNGWLALESKSKGLVITRIDNSSTIQDPKEGMLIYDKNENCVKLYSNGKWACLEKNCDLPAN